MVRYLPPGLLDGSRECFLQLPIWVQHLSTIMACVGIALCLGAGFLEYLVKEEKRTTVFYSCFVSGFILAISGALMMVSGC